MRVQGRSGEFYDIAYPMTCVFDMDLRGGSGVNSAHFMLYNLSPATRNDLQFDSAIDIDGEVVLNRSVVFKAGYQSEGALPVVFEGNIQKAFFYREGPDVVTDITVLQGLDAVQKSAVFYSASGPWSPEREARAMINLLAPYGVTLGAVGRLFDNLRPTRGAMFLGGTWDNIKKLAAGSKGCASLYNNKVYVMGPRDALVYPGPIPQLDATTGLIGTPRRSGWNVEAQMLFEPKIILWQLINLVSVINPTLNALRRVETISHRGIISGAKDAGSAITTLTLYLSPDGFNQVTPT